LKVAKSVELDDNKLFYDSLIEGGKPAIKLDYIGHRDYDIEYIYEKSEHVFYVIVYHKFNISNRVLYKFMAKEF
jgi:hypothetical protein